MAPIDEIARAIREAIGEALADKRDELTAIAVAGGGAVKGNPYGDVGKFTDLLTAVLTVITLTSPELGIPLDALAAAEGEAGKSGIGFGIGYLLGYIGFQAVNPIFLPMFHAVASAVTNEIFDPTTAAQAAVRGVMQTDHAQSDAAGGGIDSGHFQSLLGLATTHPDVTTLLEMLRRQIVDESFVTTTLKRLGYSDQAIPDLVQLQRNLLSPADLALGLLRGDITQDQFDSYMKVLGVDPFDASVLTFNTGEPPGPQELGEALRRGFIDVPTYERGIRQSRIRNEWIPTMERLRYEPMSTADAVRARVENYIDDATVAHIADQNGLEPGAIDTLVQSWGRPLSRGEMGSLVHRGLATREQFDQAMRESDVKDKYVGLAFETTRRLISERQIVSAIHFGAIDLQTGASMLLDLGFDAQATAILIKLGLNEQHTSSHELTRAQITTLYSDGTFSHAAAEKALTALGYSQQNAGYLLQIVDLQNHARELRAETTAIRNNYLANGITREEAHSQLTSIGVSVADASNTIAAWDRERRRASKLLSEAQVVKAAKTGAVTAAQAIQLLTGLGYSAGDANVLLVENGVQTT